ncbi:ATP-binding protein [Stakelama marina]|uniref:histidine kinase n=1 Tax=Stakelama marina TaxID=2826939 RepID=A0A8T4IPB1_9SPHN|nr:ATP-binding protein [Stakelama marina]MBR0553936.1 tetratricopeptide repeat protein [Stakelama marina]
MRLISPHYRWLLALVIFTISFACVAPGVALAADPAFPVGVRQQIAAAKRQMVYNPREAQESAKAAERFAKSMPGDSEEKNFTLATAQWLRAEAYLRTNAESKARPFIESALKRIANIDRPLKLRGDLLLSLVFLEMDNNEPAKALASAHEAFRIFQQVDDRRSQAKALQMIAMLYEYANDNQQAAKYYRQAGDVYHGDALIDLTQQNNLGNVLLQLEQYDGAIEQYRKALGNAKKIESAVMQVRVLGNLARAQVEADRYDEAERTLNKGLSLTDQPETRLYRWVLVVTEARIAFARKNITKAKRLISSAFQHIDPNDASAEYRDAHHIAYQIYAATGDSHLALQHLEMLKRITDKATKVASSTNAALAAARFDYKNQELRIAKLKAEELRRNVEYERAQARFQRILFISIGGATLILIGMLSFGLVTIRRSRNEVRAANTNLAASNVALERALAAKTEFLATTSHEIRTPLNGILGMTQVMLRDASLPETVRERLGVVHGAGTTMRSLVDDILDVAKMETGNMTVEQVPMNLAETLREVSRMWEEQARGRGLGFDLDLDGAPQWIESDPSRLRQVIFNLLSNALKFTQEGSVGLRAWAEQGEDGERLKIAVSDSGIGIPEEKQAEIFESFKQVDAGTTRQYGGTGLGLSICRNLSMALGGDISVESVPGEGAVFTIDLPLVRVAAPAGATQQRGEPTEDAGLLILDRNPIARSMLKALLEPRAGAVDFAGTAAEACEAVAAHNYACVLIDEATVSQDENGAFAALSDIADAAQKKSSVVAVLWKSPDAATRAAIESSGIKHLIEKPIAGAALAQRLFGGNDESQDNPPLVSRAA